MLKRPADDAPIETAIQAAGVDGDVLQELLEVDEERPDRQQRQYRHHQEGSKQTSVSKTKWLDFAAQAGLPQNRKDLRLERFETPALQLPPSFYKAVSSI
ncbi:hypothetical protein BC826DRAFT_1101407 [Russula brevipes]|nr:hypothetical protein BC826DRAFT_1101407 [Russula brevipes]